ncbi:two-component sensor histidine kinase [Paenibacillus sp. J31TS4]|uniref:sensor histidine kinase n=1 Tax=Paenibacillus sp. J31TS4 TaxID=2807195 RepID=UPI001B2E8347|nr:HAMP domain-containing sensor histidine kinase [Paenibacillus sp. J31TS4]GIP37187.1 two-component sensor histidine kinase [Paenibacillus sp. J31TS4]
MIRRAFGRLRRALVPRSLRYQLVASSFLILAGLLLLIGVFQFVLMQQFLYKNKASTIQSQIRSVPAELWLGAGGFPMRSKEDPMQTFSDAAVSYRTPDGTLLHIAQGPHAGTAPELPEALYREALRQQASKEPFYRLVKNEEGEKLLVVLQAVGQRGRGTGIVQISASTAQMRDVLVRQLVIFLSLSTAALLIGLLSLIPLLRRTLDPLSRIVDSVEQINSRSLNERLPTRQGQLEIDRLAVSFNGMMGRLESSFEAEREAKEQMRRFVADASHELRTPLTSIHGFLEVLLRGAAQAPEQLDRALKSMYAESGRINKLVHDLLMLARLDQTPSMKVEAGSLAGVLEEMEPQLKLLAGSREVVLEPDSGRVTQFDADKIKQVILNLFHNAVQYTDPAHGSIRVALADGLEGGVVLTVGDNGPGIPPEHLPRILDRFYRIDASRARRHGGAGLGLSITKAIVELHGGSLEVESVPGEGTTFRVLLPAVPPRREEQPPAPLA